MLLSVGITFEPHLISFISLLTLRDRYVFSVLFGVILDVLDL